MNKAKVVLKIFNDEGWRIFALAILASLIWHLFWLSTIVIVSKPLNSRSVRFSRVSFLGPLLGKGSMELQARPKESSFLEMRYLGAADRLAQRPGEMVNTTAYRYESGDDAYRMRDEKITAYIDDVLMGQKSEPPYEEK